MTNSQNPDPPPQTPDLDLLQSPTTHDLNPAHTIAPPQIELPELDQPKKRKRWAKSTASELAAIVDMHARGVALDKIAGAVGRPRSTVWLAIRKFGRVFKGLKSVPNYEKTRQSILSAVELESLKLMVDPNKQQTAKLRDVAYMFKCVHGANRLERNLSTANVSTAKLDPVRLDKSKASS